ncbi:MAG TPA: hypothetical protein DC049_14240, partial [Spirochaetia bacterium]|nr:hypothetical protein [Spirochaetia bacterium]
RKAKRETYNYKIAFGCGVIRGPYGIDCYRLETDGDPLLPWDDNIGHSYPIITGNLQFWAYATHSDTKDVWFINFNNTLTNDGDRREVVYLSESYIRQKYSEQQTDLTKANYIATGGDFNLKHVKLSPDGKRNMFVLNTDDGKIRDILIASNFQAPTKVLLWVCDMTVYNVQHPSWYDNEHILLEYSASGVVGLLSVEAGRNKKPVTILKATAEWNCGHPSRNTIFGADVETPYIIGSAGDGMESTMKIWDGTVITELFTFNLRGIGSHHAHQSWNKFGTHIYFNAYYNYRAVVCGFDVAKLLKEIE